MSRKLFIVISMMISSYLYSSSIYLNGNNKNINIQSWKSIRNSQIVKQDFDFSCGAASIATLLNGYFYQDITEKEVLSLINNGNVMASFSDLQEAIQKLGFESRGYAISLEALKELDHPVIAYIKYGESGHFTVISGTNKNFIKVSDPSLGNKIFTIQQFRNIWETRSAQNLKGKILVISSKNKLNNPNFFIKNMTYPPKTTIKLIQIKYS